MRSDLSIVVGTLVLLSTMIVAENASQIAQKSYNVNHTVYIDNLLIKRDRKQSILTISRLPHKKARVMEVERYLSNSYKNSPIEAKDLIIIRSGKLKGMGILMTSYLDTKRSHEYLMWLPALRKVRRMAEPKDAGLGTGDIAFLEDAKLRRFNEEDYELLETKMMNLELKMIDFKKGEFGRQTKYFPKNTSIKTGVKKIHIIKSTFKDKYHWYDYRISHIDSQTYTDYVTYYYKDNTRIKSVYRQWVHLGNLSDPKAKTWHYWYSIDPINGYEVVTYIPKHLIKVNQKVKPSFWSEYTLRKLKR